MRILLLLRWLQPWVGVAKSWGTARHCAGQRFEDRNKIAPRFRRKPKRLDLGVQMIAGDSAPVVEGDHRCERRQASVVHVGRGARHLPQRWRLERADVLQISAYACPA